MAQVGSRAGYLIKVTRNFMDEMVFANHRPADNYIDAAVDDFRVDGEDGFRFIRDFVKER